MKNLRKLTAVVTAVVLAAMLLAVSVAAASAPKAKLNKTNITISVGETYYLYVNGAVDSISWSSSDKSVATVSKGKVTGKSVGTAVIIAKHGSTSLSCTVEVKKKGESGKVTIAKYLFDDKPYMYEHILLATRNSDFLNAEEANNYWHYYDVDATTKMPSGGKEYKKGMNLVADSSYTAGIYYKS